MIRNYITILFMLLSTMLVKAQIDSTVFTPDQLLWYIEKYHPVSIQSNLLLEKGESEVRSARGNFDPYLYAGLDQKYYGDNQYYSILGTGLKVPTWYGVELKAGYDQNQGYNLNPQNKVPDDGLWYAGISVPIGKGLIIDKRRASLQQAKLYAESTKAEQEKMMLSLYFGAIKKYWDWVEAYNEYKIFTEAVELANVRLLGIKGSYQYGDKSAIDTLEAYILVQNRELSKTQARLKYNNVTLELSNYLWYEDGMPLTISDQLHPPLYKEVTPAPAISTDSLSILIKDLAFRHPDMQIMDYKIESMEVALKLKKQDFMPDFKVNYNFINQPHGGNLFQNYSINNYKWGFNFSMPLFLRSERGDYNMQKLKVQDAQLDLNQKLLALENELRKHYNTQITLNEQVKLYQDVVENYGRMFSAEKRRFESGESSLFIVNARETSLIEAQLKLVSLLAKYNVSQVGVGYAAGLSIYSDNQ